MNKPPAINPVSAGVVRGQGPNRESVEARTVAKGAGDFGKILEKAFDETGISFSRHAKERIHSRRIEIDASDARRMSDAIDTLRSKGGRISLLLMGDTTFVTNVKNRTVITAVDRYGESDKVFTQIDSAAVIEKA